MPKKFEDSKRKEWLELYESGKTEKWIARQARCDPRTVRKAIQELRLKQDVIAARREMVKDALCKHQGSLLEELDRIFFELKVPPQDFAVLSWYSKGDSVFKLSKDADEQQIANAIRNSLPPPGESALRRLLKQHLKGDKLWKLLAQWEKSNAFHLATRAALQLKTAALIQQETGNKLVDDGGTPPLVYSYTACDLLFKNVLKLAFNSLEDRYLEKAFAGLESAIGVDLNNGNIMYLRSTILAVTPGNEERTKKNLLSAFSELVKSPEVKPVVDTYWALEEITMKAGQLVEQFKLLGLIPGQCDICRRLGI